MSVKAVIKDWDYIPIGSGIKVVGLVESSTQVKVGESIVTSHVVAKDGNNNIITKSGSVYALSNLHSGVSETPDLYKQQFLDSLSLLE